MLLVRDASGGGSVLVQHVIDLGEVAERNVPIADRERADRAGEAVGGAQLRGVLRSEHVGAVAVCAEQVSGDGGERRRGLEHIVHAVELLSSGLDHRLELLDVHLGQGVQGVGAPLHHGSRLLDRGKKPAQRLHIDGAVADERVDGGLREGVCQGNEGVGRGVLEHRGDGPHGAHVAADDGKRARERPKRRLQRPVHLGRDVLELLRRGGDGGKILRLDRRLDGVDLGERRGRLGLEAGSRARERGCAGGRENHEHADDAEGYLEASVLVTTVLVADELVIRAGADGKVDIDGGRVRSGLRVRVGARERLRAEAVVTVVGRGVVAELVRGHRPVDGLGVLEVLCHAAPITEQANADTYSLDYRAAAQCTHKVHTPSPGGYRAGCVADRPRRRFRGTKKGGRR